MPANKLIYAIINTKFQINNNGNASYHQFISGFASISFTSISAIILYHIIQCTSFNRFSFYLFDKRNQFRCCHRRVLFFRAGHRINFCGIINGSINIIYTKG